MSKNILFFQFWVGERVNYSCRSSKKLFFETNTTGLESVTVECLQLENLGAWWSPSSLPPCAENLVKAERKFEKLE